MDKLKELTLEDLTKDELIELITREVFKIHPRRIADVRWHSMTKKSQELMKQGCEITSKVASLKGYEHILEFNRGSKIFDQGQKLSDDASKFAEEYLGI
jgi:hypothetical protein